MKRGFLLLFVLGLLGIFSLIAINFIHHTTHGQALSQKQLLLVSARSLALSGFEYAVRKSFDIANIPSQGFETISVGSGLFKPKGNIVDIHLKDTNSKINVNDGMNAGLIDQSISTYDQKAMNPWYDGFENHSAQINLRLRRLLNAYGDVHRFVDHVFDDDYQNCSLSTYYKKTLPRPVFSSRTPISYAANFVLESEGSPDGPRFVTMSSDKVLDINNYNNALGDRIIESRPLNGYRNDERIEEIANLWANDSGIELTKEYLNNQPFFEHIKNDLTSFSFEDTQFHRYDRSSHSQYHYYLDPPHHGDLKLSYLMTGNTPNYFNEQNLRGHSVALINLSQASFYVRAAVFYAPTNVDYSCESANTIPAYFASNTTENLGNVLFDQTTALEAMINIPSYSYGPPVFNPEKEDLENGHHLGRKSHLMSLRDAMYLAHQYEVYQQIMPQKNITNFDDFTTFLIWHEKNSRSDFPSYERAHPINTYQNILSGDQFNAGGLFHVSSFSDLDEQPGYGEFAQDYISKTLPHIFSCIRRIPSYYNAPLALQSPYMVLQPDKTNTDYYENKVLCKQSFRKVEDFVKRISQPKVCFLPTGIFDISCQAKIMDIDNQVVSSSSVQASSKSFETKYYRFQKDFLKLTDSDRTHADIKIGPEIIDHALSDTTIDTYATTTHLSINYLGFVGLKDFDDDILLSDAYSSYTPQIVMNFDPWVDDGLTNTSDVISPPQRQDPTQDPWTDAINADTIFDPSSAVLLERSKMEGSDKPIFHHNATDDPSDLSAFNGVSFLDTNKHFPFSYSIYYQYGFKDSLYWRLDHWLDETQPTGNQLSSGVTTFWFRMPSTYNDTHPIGLDTAQITPNSFSYILMSLNLWESFEQTTANPTMYRPVALTVGLKKTNGLRVFARYDSGGPPHTIMTPQAVHYVGAIVTDDEMIEHDYTSLVPSIFNEDAPIDHTQYDYFGYVCLTAGEGNTYDYYRRGAYRSSEVSIKFKSDYEAGPGSWHRILVGWNLSWPGNGELEKNQQLWLRLLNMSAQNDIEDVYTIHEDYVSGNYVTDLNPNPLNPLHLVGAPHYPGGDLDSGGGLGFMLPYNSSMVLSLGEAQGRRLIPYHFLSSGSDFQFEAREGDYHPLWRLHSSIDNFRLWMGPSDPHLSENTEYTDASNIIYTHDIISNQILSAMRYNITNSKWHDLPEGFHAEPTWVINPKLPQHSKIISVGTRVYYPPDSNNNTAYVKLSLTDKSQEIIPDRFVSQNEQDLFYTPYKVNNAMIGTDNPYEPLRIHLQYQAHKPKLNGKQQDLGDPLVYTGNDNFTNLAWIKEVSIKHTLTEYPIITTLKFNDE